MPSSKIDKLYLKAFKGKDILVTGGCGSIGSEIVRQLLKYKPERIRIFDQDESAHFHMREQLPSKVTRHLVGSVRDKSRIERAMMDVDIVFHAAALKHVPLCEYNPYEAVLTNVIGTQNLIEVARNHNVEKFITISTDKAANPINTMGATKLLGEKLTTTAGYGNYRTKFACVRFGNVLNSDGSVIPIFKRQIKKGGPITITSEDMTRFFMSISDAVSLVLKSAAIMKGDEVFVLKMKTIKITDLAKALVEELAPKYGFKAQNIKYKIIGVRPGEKISEILFTKEEANQVKELDDMFILMPSINTPQLIQKYDSEKVFEQYDSENSKHLSVSQIKQVLKKYDII